MIRLCRLVRRLWTRVRNCFVRPYQTVVVEDVLPEQLQHRTLYIVREDGFDEQAAMLCPCGCENILHLNLLADERPCWRVLENADGKPTLYPSVWRRKDCGSHFWLRNGRILWC